jgi:hypothetical protein
MTEGRPCAICGRPVHWSACICYTDEERGLKNANIHKSCLRAHILEYFPDSDLARHLVFNPGTYPAKAEPGLDD